MVSHYAKNAEESLMRSMMLAASICLFSGLTGVAQDAPQVELNDAEQKFVDLLSKSVMVGQFTIDGREDGQRRPEKYAIASVTKVKDNSWIVQARITYGKYDLPVPVPVQVLWAGDTPVLQVTDLKIPLMGEGFTARVMFYEDRYAGSWYHGKVGGHMYGKIEKQDSPTVEDQKPNVPAPATE